MYSENRTSIVPIDCRYECVEVFTRMCDDGPNSRTRLTDIGAVAVEIRVFAPLTDGNNLHAEVVGRRNGRNTTGDL